MHLNTNNVVAGYIRVSTGRQATEGKSLQYQEEIIRQHAEMNNQTVYKIYKDEGISGASIEKRDGLKSLLADVKGKPQFSKVYVWDLSRLTRSQADQYKIVDELHINNIELISLNNQGADFNTASGRLMTGIFGSLNEYYRYQLKENINQGMQTRTKNGFTSSKPALGYNRGLTSNDPLQVNEQEAETVQYIFNLAEAGQGYRAIANKLNKEGYLTKNANPYDTNAVKYILNNKLYCGYVVWGKYKDWHKKRRKGKSEPMITKGKHEAIITEEQYNRVQDMLQLRSKQPQHTKKTNLLTGLLKCPQCGGPMRVSHNTSRRKNKPDVKYKLYSCANSRRSGPTVCRANSVKASDIESIVEKLFNELIDNKTLLKQVVKEANDMINHQVNRVHTPNVKLQTDIDELIEKINRLHQMMETDESLRDVLTPPINDYKEQLKTKQASQNNLLEPSKQTYQTYSIEELSKVLIKVKQALSSKSESNLELIKDIYNAIIERIEFQKDGPLKIEDVRVYLHPHVASLIESQNTVEGPKGSSAFLFPHGICLTTQSFRYKHNFRNIL